ncbi:MAG: hypothetical protein WC843_04335 [Candidatus Gracilibacteria bacterium]|jgi:hypothetical protein
MLLFCKNKSLSSCTIPKRLVFSHGSSTPPNPDDEHLNEALHEVELARQERIDRLYASPDKKHVTNTQLGVHGDVAAALGHHFGDKILEARMHKRLRDFVEHGDKMVSEHSVHKSMHHEVGDKGLVMEKTTKAGHAIVKGKSKIVPKGLIDFFVNIYNRYKGRPEIKSNIFIEGDMVDSRIEQDFGNNRGLDAMKESLMKSMSSHLEHVLDNASTTVNSMLAVVGIAPVSDIGKLLVSLKGLTYTQLKKISETTYNLGGDTFFIFGPKNSDLRYVFDKFVALRKIETEERAKMFSKDRHDPDKLKKFRDVLKDGADGSDEKEAYTVLFERIFKDKTPNGETLYNIKNADNAALLLELEHIYKTKGAAELLKKLNKIYGALPSSKEKKPTEEGKETPESIKLKEQIEEQEKVLFDEKDLQELIGAYGEASMVNENFATAEETYNSARTKPTPAVAGGPVTAQMQANARQTAADVAKNLLNAETNLKAAREKKSELLKKVNALEGKFKRAAGIITSVFDSESCTTKIDKDIQEDKTKTPPVDYEPSKIDPRLNQLIAISTSNLTTSVELFPPIVPAAAGATAAPVVSSQPDSGFFKFFSEKFTEDFQARLKKEIKTHKEYLNPKSKATPRQLLFLLKKQDFEARGVTNPEMNDRYANIAANLAVADARSAGVHGAANNELAEANMGGFRGWLRRKTQFIQKNRFSSNVYTAQDAIETIAQDDLIHFRHLTKHSTVADIRNILNEHPMDAEKLREFAQGLESIFRYKKIDEGHGHSRTVEIYDFDWDIEVLINNVRIAEAELITRQSIYKAEHPENEDDKKKEISVRMLEHVKTQVELEQKQSGDIEKNLYKKLRTLSPHVLEAEQKATIIKEYEEAKAHGLSGEALLHHFATKTLTNAWKLFGKALAAKEIYDMGKAGINFVKGLKGSKKAKELPAHGGAESPKPDEHKPPESH